MHSLNAKELEQIERSRRFLPVLRRKASRLYELVAAEVWYRLQAFRREKDEVWVPPSRLPPMRLRQKVNGLRDIYSFLATGETCASDIERALGRVGRDLDSFERILDFGCGCGRTLLYLAERVGGAEIHGSDSDERAIEWCRTHLPFGRFEVNDPFPPLRYEPDSFDLVYVISLFTHFDEDSQRRWIEELERVTRPGGIVIATFHGRYCWSDFSGEVRSELERSGFAFVETHPDWPPHFQTAYHTEEYVRREFGRSFEVLDYLPRGLNRHQDLALLRKRKP